MKNVDKIINLINRTEYDAKVDGTPIKYKIELVSKFHNEYGVVRKKYYIHGYIDIFNTGNLKVDPDTTRAFTAKVFKLYIQAAYDLLIKKMSIDNYILLDPGREGRVIVSYYHMDKKDQGPYEKDTIATQSAVSFSVGNPLRNDDWFRYYTTRFPNR